MSDGSSASPRVPRHKTKSKEKPRTPNPWDRLPWPTEAVYDALDAYAAVGWALTEWEKFDDLLGQIFCMLIEAPKEARSARRAYRAVRTFEGRIQMIKVAAEVYFQDRHFYSEVPDDGLKSDLSKLIGQALNFVARRNDIAHGVMQDYVISKTSMLLGRGHVLYPSMANSKDRDVNHIAEYAFDARGIKYYADQFAKLQRPAYKIIFVLVNERAFPYKPV